MALRLLYFKLRGRGEAARLALAYTETEFVDDRRDFAEFPALKGTLPFGQLPVLYVGDVAIPQSFSIVRYIARNCGGGKLYPTDPVQAAIAESIADQVADVGTAGYAASNSADKAAALAAFKADKLPGMMKGIVSYLGDAPFFGGAQPNFADFILYAFVERSPSWGLDVCEGGAFPTIKAHSERFRALPQLGAYFARRAEVEAAEAAAKAAADAAAAAAALK